MELCIVDGCERETTAHGWCPMHYTRWRTHGHTDDPPKKPARLCDVEGCERKHRARGLCSSHYNQQHQPDRHKPATTQCVACGTPVSKRGSRGKRYRPTCSTMCRYYLQFGEWQSSTWVQPAWPQCALPARHPAMQPKPKPPRVFASGHCQHCHSPFTTETTSGEARYCSDRCAKRYAKKISRHKRRAIKHAADYEPGITWQTVAKRDGMNCHLCGDATNTTDYEVTADGTWLVGITYPSLDHVLPLSKGGAHTLSNTKLAHFMCNWEKNDTVPLVA